MPPFPAESGGVTLPGPAGPLELACSQPEPDTARRGVAVLSHPHPLHGGTMHNKVVTILERSMLELGLATVRFNFRGVGHSAGEYDDGIGETDDLAAVCDWVRATRPGDTLWLGGFSFGAYVTLRAASRVEPAQLVLIAPPVGRWDFSAVAPPACPWLVVQGDEDEVVDARTVIDWARELGPPVSLVEIPEAGHFFHRRLMDLRGVLKNGLGANRPPLRAA